MPARQLATAWLRQQRVLKENLIAARGTGDREVMREAVARAIARYEAYYRVRAETVRADPVRFYCTPWATPLERGTHWIAGLRPSALIHLLYSESGLRFQAQLEDLLEGVHSGDLGDLSPDQLSDVDDVQRRTIREEGEIGDELDELQLGVADTFPVSDSDLDEKMGRMEGIIGRADGLRMQTLKNVLEILEPVQAVDLLVAAADLEIGMRQIGMGRYRRPDDNDKLYTHILQFEQNIVMVRFLKRGSSLSKLMQGKGMLDSERRTHSMVFDAGDNASQLDDRMMSRSQGSKVPSRSVDGQQIGSVLDRAPEKAPRSRLSKETGPRDGQPSDMEMMKERFAKLLLGEDMSGGGKGVSSALALSNAITNLAASVFGEQWRLEPMSAERKARWRREVDWLLSVTDHIVEFVPSQQISKDGTNMEIMVTQQRKDLHMNIPALRKLDAMLIEYLDNFKDHNEFWYVSRDATEAEKGGAQRKDDKWWLPTAKVPPEGLSDVSRKWLQYQKELVNQVLKAAMAINANVLMEMEIPEAYIEALPKNGRASLGDALYKSITDENFDPEDFLSSLDFSSEHKILDLKNRIEASVVIWKRKMHNKDVKSPWGSAVSIEKREQFEERAETILLILKHRFPGIPQSSLDISKIQENKDVGQSILESYSRVLESLAYTVMSRIEDVLYADSLTRDPSLGHSKKKPSFDAGPVKVLDPKEEIEKLNNMEAGDSMTLSDFMGWHEEQDAEVEKKSSVNFVDMLHLEDSKLSKLAEMMINKKTSYIEKLENLGGLRSPIPRH
ncbi:hypothetical protein J5N97_019770 [Dioscorea zingiberensis]|uniref:PRONE domain-containing protein n=1 Tax=Dioscorea zingiberensis TaxID=325984 RepID=A0A9D5CEH6_9LILI|nr:hypothetical protein J5N97_019770 [Dioscorea zingiberensis]